MGLSATKVSNSRGFWQVDHLKEKWVSYQLKQTISPPKTVCLLK